MAIGVNNNYNNINSYVNNNNINNTLQRVATGLQINQAADNPAALAIANQLLAEGNALGQSVQNTNSGVAMLQIADKAMDEQSNILDTIEQKMIQASTATTDDAGREMILQDVQKLMDQFNNIAEQTNYNGTSLLQQSATDDNPSDTFDFQAGTSETDTISSSAIQANSTGVGLNGLMAETAGTFTADQARSYLTTIQSAQDTLSSFRSDIGSTQNQLESATRNLMTQETNTLAAQAIIMETDYAKESANFSSQNVISQAGAFSISQANAVQGNVLRLLQ